MNDISPTELQGEICSECDAEITPKPIGELECDCTVYSFLYNVEGKLRLAQTMEKQITQ